MLHRLVARMRFADGHWGPGWCYQQMQVRHGQAVHIRQGEAAAERPRNRVFGGWFTCDLPLADEAAAEDAFATLSDHNVLGVTVPFEDGVPSSVQYHLCDHADDDRSGCVVQMYAEGPS